MGLALIELDADGLFKSFLQAGSARVLVSVRPGSEAEVLFYLLYGLLWPGRAENSPVAAIDVGLAADLSAPQDPQPSASWRLRIPTSLSLLQLEENLPAFSCPWPEKAPVTRGVDP